ncbi:UDP-N-acetylglucosamine--undecaprenyl-phosphate N-acetylglucosaminephosphotransferase [Serratia sp. JUb9]|uniref:UDP-N-acetylglucosamine--undecaprenyl-phosphate N-acetylglucosaminephosphotransferase n=1 Tax=unclassified Serratia (in: enterobacteria) TaxID=2647522 RepID=UPI00164E77D1|nr:MULTISPECIES: UDP-N-acetylglucosamine--undecaprenyl-phosphate N-acetylglucosaminephosphotransferase [unclassified Serratia (in: enterobacteria)]QNK34325.1 UDP-N-acetylglucosamine--undecaprenyl-phosphate N-acetylglucosaminephosphotransferase [Serratia sp. JUb9]CAE1147095.1 Undecaprenyl-phosphate alpha-N-acetylglucosaminyl 1-phosphate transferase [Serratia sp. Tan611]
MVYQLGVIFFLALLLMAIARGVALKLALVDKPSARKQHQGHIPLCGGIAIYLSVALFSLWQPDGVPHMAVYLCCVTALLLLGVLDDRFELSVAPRMAVQGGLALVMMLAAGMRLSSLGSLWGGEALQLGYGALLVTPLAVWGAINAYNMVDGIDGQLGIQSCVTLAGLAVLFALGGRLDTAFWCLSLIVTLAAYLLFNLGFFGRRNRIFMGDAGSMVMGFTVLWLLLSATQGDGAVMRPVGALWLIAMPLMDMVSVMLRRIARRQSPFRAGRDHLHHILMRRGLSARQALAVSGLLALALAVVGLSGELMAWQESLMLAAFMLCSGGYFLLVREPRRTTMAAGSPAADR